MGIILLSKIDLPVFLYIVPFPLGGFVFARAPFFLLPLRASLSRSIVGLRAEFGYALLVVSFVPVFLVGGRFALWRCSRIHDKPPARHWNNNGTAQERQPNAAIYTCFSDTP